MAKYHIHGISISSNTWKTLYVAEELKVDYQYTSVDLQKGEHKTTEHLKRHPLGKVPTLTIGDDHIFESQAICRFLARNEDSNLYPNQALECARVDQWMNLFTCHLGAAFNSYTFETVAKEKYGLGTPNKEVADSALENIRNQLPTVERHLADSKFLGGSSLTIADLFGFAYTENAEVGGIGLNDYPNFHKWFTGIQQLDSIKRAHERLGR